MGSNTQDRAAGVMDKLMADFPGITKEQSAAIVGNLLPPS